MPKTIDGSIISLIILLFIFFNAYDRHEERTLQNRIFISMVSVNMVLLVLDLLTWYFNGRSGSANFVLNKVLNILLFTLQPAASSLALLYIRSLTVFKRKTCNVKAAITLIFTLNTAFTLTSLLTGWYFLIDAANTYQRGPLFFVHEILCLTLFVYSIYCVCRNRECFSKKDFTTLLFFFLPQIAGIIIQFAFYGYSTILIGMMLSLTIAYLNIQSSTMNTDHLTRVNNRRNLDNYIAGKIKDSTKEFTFAAFMIDIDNFKVINDSFGHDVGDKALKDTAQILRISSKRNDFIARLGGDEFILVADVKYGHEVENIACRIRENFEDFNRENIRPYKLNFSIGYYKYDPGSKMDTKQLISYIDKLMYENKKTKNKNPNVC